MRITTDVLRAANACEEQRDLFAELYPDGLEPTVEWLSEAAAHGLDVWWCWHLLPAEGPGSQRAYALWCAEQVAHLCSDRRVAKCLAVVRRRVARPASVSDAERAAAGDAARAAAGAAAWAAAWAAAGAAAWAAARAAAGDAQLAALSALLLETER